MHKSTLICDLAKLTSVKLQDFHNYPCSLSVLSRTVSDNLYVYINTDLHFAVEGICKATRGRHNVTGILSPFETMGYYFHLENSLTE